MAKDNTESVYSALPSILIIIATLLALMGLGASLELTRLHYLIHTDPAHQSWCHVGATINCDSVERSSYAVLFGVPLAIWGVLGYLVVLGVLLSARWRQKDTIWPRGALWGLALLFTLFSAYNLYVSVVLLGAMCLLCLTTYVANLGLLVVSALALRSLGHGYIQPIFEDLRRLMANPLKTGLAFVTFVLVSAALMLWYPAYWQSPEAKIQHIEGLATGITPQGAHWIGAKNPVLTIEEFSDYQCPFCAKSHAVVRSAVSARPEQLRLIHRHFPLDMACNRLLKRPMHLHACYAAKAVNCAARQHKFWQLNDQIFAHQQGLTDEKIDRMAQELGLDLKLLKSCMQDDAVQDEIAKDVDDATKFKVRGTPFYLINGKPHRGGLTLQVIDQLLKEKP